MPENVKPPDFRGDLYYINFDARLRRELVYINLDARLSGKSKIFIICYIRNITPFAKGA